VKLPAAPLALLEITHALTPIAGSTALGDALERWVGHPWP
jgi:hypothetical protein